MKISLLTTTLFLFTTVLFAQNNYKENIQKQAKDLVLEYENLLNQIANNQASSVEISDFIQNSFTQNHPNQIFVNPLIIVEDDLIPNTKKEFIKEIEIQKYLMDFDLFYTKSDSQSVVFSNISLGEIKLGDNYIFLQIAFDCQFKNRHKAHQSNYKSQARLLEIQIDKQTQNWKALIAGIHFFDDLEDILTSELPKDSVLINFLKQKIPPQLDCLNDDDKDGIVNCKDSCLNTPKGFSVNKKGCEHKFQLHKTLFLGINYQLGKQASQSRWGISAYYPIGFFIQGFQQSQDPLPNFYYSMNEIENAKIALQNNGVAFQDLEYKNSGSNLRSYNFGLYFSTYRSFYLMLGLARSNGYIWNNYEGDLKNEIPTENNIYSIDYQQVNTNNYILGLAYVQPYFQAELGYNALFDNFFINLGLNYPIQNIKILKPKKP